MQNLLSLVLCSIFLTPLYRGFPRGISSHLIIDTEDTKGRDRSTFHLLTRSEKVAQVVCGLDHYSDVLIFLHKLKRTRGDSYR